MKQFRDRIAVITGSASGMGLATARNLADKGCHLALSDINEAGLQAAKEELSQKVNVHTGILDVSDREAWSGYTESVLSHFGSVNIVINNAGNGITGDVEDMDIEDFERTMNIHFGGVLYGTKSFLPTLKQQDEAHIVNLSSAAGLIGAPGLSAYCAAKFAIRGFTESLRQEMADTRVGVSCVHPGAVATSILKNSEEPTGKSLLGIDTLGSPEEKEEMMKKLALTTADEAATIIVNGIKNNTPRVLVGPDAYVFDAIQRVAPVNYSVMHSLLRIVVERMQPKSVAGEAVSLV